MNLAIQQRIADMLANKIAMEGGALVGGKKHRKRHPTAHNRKVAAYMRKHGVTLGQASHALKSRGYDEDDDDDYDYDDLFGEERRHRRKRRVGRPRKHRGGKLSLSSKELEKLMYTPEKRFQNKKAERQWVREQLLAQKCREIPKNATKNQLKEWYERCNETGKRVSPSKVLKEALKGILTKAKTDYSTKYDDLLSTARSVNRERNQTVEKTLRNLLGLKGLPISQ